MIDRLCIIGVGLIGGSLARALKTTGACKEVVGYGRNAASLKKALQLGVIDRFETKLYPAVKGSDIVVICVPVGAMKDVFCQLAPLLTQDMIVTDVGSSKRSVVEAAQTAFGYLPANFVPGHPIAGTEQSGVEASFAELYHGRRVILTPVAETDHKAVEAVQSMWQKAGAVVTKMQVDHHDEVLAATSHLPHLLAFTLVESLARMDEKAEIFEYAAGGFRDFTRIASSDPVMWHDICLANAKELLNMLNRFSADLEKLRKAIKEGDSQYIMSVFQTAKQARDRFCGN
jgi:prephenate dehydrogenase